MSGQVYEWTGQDGNNGWSTAGNWFDVSTNSAASTSPGPLDDAIVPGGNYYIGFNINAAGLVDQGNLLFPYPSTVQLDNAWLQPGASIESWGYFNAVNVELESGSSLTLSGAGYNGFNFINELWNDGGSVHTIDNANLLIGGPGFAQVGITTPGEVNLHNGPNAYINLGNIAQGSTVAPVALNLVNATGAALSDDFITYSQGGFSFSGFGPESVPNQYLTPDYVGTPAGSVDVNTSTLGQHVAVVGFGPYAVGITDNIVPA